MVIVNEYHHVAASAFEKARKVAKVKQGGQYGQQQCHTCGAGGRYAENRQQHNQQQYR